MRSTSGFRAIWRYYSAVLGFGAVLLLLVLPVAQGGQAQRGGSGGLLGTINDGENVAAAGLDVFLRKNGDLRITATDRHGHFEILNLDPGIYTLEVSGDGYQPAIDRSVEIMKGRPTTLTMQVAVASSVRVIYEPPASVSRPRSVTDRP